LHVDAGAHLLGTSQKHPHLAAADLVEEGPLLGVGVGRADGGDLRAGDAPEGELADDVVVG
jgi:hypothetical protein